MVRPIAPWPKAPPLPQSVGKDAKPMNYVPTPPRSYIDHHETSAQLNRIGPSPLWVAIWSVPSVFVMGILAGSLGTAVAIATLSIAVVSVFCVAVLAVTGWRTANEWRRRALLAEAKRRDEGPYRTIPELPADWQVSRSEPGIESWARMLHRAGVTVVELEAAFRKVSSR